MGKISTYWNTVKYLKPVQLVYQVRNKFAKKYRVYYEKLPVEYRVVNLAIPELDCDELLVERFKPDFIKHGKVCLLNQIVDLKYDKKYTPTLKPLIVNNLFYFEYGIALAAQYKKTKDIAYWNLFRTNYELYLNTHADLKSVYSMALHIPNVLIALELFGDAVEDDFREKIYCELYSQYKYISKHQEKHLLANHYFEDLKALVIASYLFKDDKNLKHYLKAFRKQCDEQILQDGVHYELSLMYQKLILEDVMRIAMLAKQPDFPKCDWILLLIQRMIDACYSLEKGLGRTPLFNDAGDNVAKTCEQLCLAAKKQFEVTPVLKDTFNYSRYYKLYDGNRALILDAGKIGVDYQPAHGHCDCLSFELSIDGTPLFVNSGTYEYQGDLRKYFRTTRAHNTVEINGHEQSQCWGGFRVSKRISDVKSTYDDGFIKGSYKNHLGETHKRLLTLNGGLLRIEDATIAKKGVSVKSYLHIAPGFKVIDSTIQDITGRIMCRVNPINADIELIKTFELCYYAVEFSDLKLGQCLVFSWKADNEQHGYEIDFNI